MASLSLSRVSLAGLGARTGVAVAASSGTTCLVEVAGIRVDARVVPGLSVPALSPVLILRKGSVYYVITVLPAAPVVAAPPPAQDDPVPVIGDRAPTPKPTYTTGSLVCHPVATSTYRDSSWRTDGDPINSFDTYQGRYAGSGFGRNIGCAFYGSKPATLSGATVTRVTVKLRRLSGGDYGQRSCTLRLLTESTRPAGSPTLIESTTGPALGVRGKVSPSETTFTLPDLWGQALANGSRGGLAISVGSDDPYIHLAGRGSWSAAWVLTLYWRRSS